LRWAGLGFAEGLDFGVGGELALLLEGLVEEGYDHGADDGADALAGQRAGVGEALDGRDEGLVGEVVVLGVGDVGLAAAKAGEALVDSGEVLAIELVIDCGAGGGLGDGWAGVEEEHGLGGAVVEGV
jgi:hypothetical protein